MAATRRTSTRCVLRAAEPLELLLLEHAQELGLERRRDVADLVEEERAAVRQLEAADLLRDRPGEGALLVAEQLALQQVERDGRAVELDEGAPAARAELVDRPRDQLLAGARLAQEQHRGIGRRHALDLLERPLQGPAGPDDLREPRVVARSIAVARCRYSSHGDLRRGSAPFGFSTRDPLARSPATPRRRTASPGTPPRRSAAPASASARRREP